MTRIIILMATYNGAPHLQAQLDSFEAQGHDDWELWVSDDCSTDETLDILVRFKTQTNHPVRILQGPSKGSTANFNFLLQHPQLPAGPVAFSDQDDVWHADKLERALAALNQHPGQPVLYASRTDIGFEPDQTTGKSPLFQRPACFQNALIQTIGGGHTMVVSQQAIEIMRRANPAYLPAFHDWWAYLLISGAGGQVIYDPVPTVFYRQHANNLLGRNRGWRARYGRIDRIAQGGYHHWITRNLIALEQSRDLLTEENREILDLFRKMRKERGRAALTLWRQIGLYRQAPMETRLMAYAAMRGRI